MSDITNNSQSSSVSTGAVRASFVLLDYDPSSRQLRAQLEPSSEAQILSVELLRDQIAEEGFADLYTTDDVLRPVVLAANKAQTGSFVIAERRDAKLQLKISADKLSLQANAESAWGGDPLTEEAVWTQLRELGVPSRCVIPDALEALLSAAEPVELVLARAQPPEKGLDTRFEVLVEGCRSLELQEDAKGRVDFYESHEFLVVDVGTPLMRRLPPTQGKMGIDVCGTLLHPEPGKELPFGRDREGADISPGDPNLLVAISKGHPIVLTDSVKLDPVLRLKNVSLATGNVSFDGSVEIAGDVASGLSVQASGDVFVHGTVEKARVTAKRNLVIRGGVIGDDLGRDEQGELILRTRLRAGGDLSAKFINLADASAGRNLMVREYVMQSHLKAGDHILLGQSGGKGSLIGGRAQAGERLVANIVGSEAYVQTEVRIGRENLKRRWLDRLKQAYKQTQSNLQQLQQLLDNPQSALAVDTRARVEATLTSEAGRQVRIRNIIERLLARQKSGRPGRIEVKRNLYANVSITIDGVTQLNEVDHGPRTLVRQGVELVVKV